jgi:hypothetical protein
MTKSLVALVGMKHRGTEALVASLPQGEPLTLVREHGNKFDPFAVQVWARGQHVGFIKATQVKPIALAMDRAALPLSEDGPMMPAKLAIDGGKWPMIELEI